MCSWIRVEVRFSRARNRRSKTVCPDRFRNPLNSLFLGIADYVYGQTCDGLHFPTGGCSGQPLRRGPSLRRSKIPSPPSTAPDSIVCVDEGTLLRIAGVARSTRRNWVKQSLIDDRSDGRYYEQDVLETALVALIVKATKGLVDARLVWHSNRDSLITRCFVAMPPPGVEPGSTA
jgi:hypothetical protein